MSGVSISVPSHIAAASQQLDQFGFDVRPYVDETSGQPGIVLFARAGEEGYDWQQNGGALTPPNTVAFVEGPSTWFRIFPSDADGNPSMSREALEKFVLALTGENLPPVEVEKAPEVAPLRDVRPDLQVELAADVAPEASAVMRPAAPRPSF